MAAGLPDLVGRRVVDPKNGISGDDCIVGLREPIRFRDNSVAALPIGLEIDKAL
jgi:hypothetical protein